MTLKKINLGKGATGYALKPKRRNKRPEAQMQEALIAWSKWVDIDPNDKSKGKIGGKLMAYPAGGFRNILEARALKRMGVQAGIPDLFLRYPMEKDITGYDSYTRWTRLLSGLWIELKTEKGKLTQIQKEKIAELQIDGYRVEVAHSLEEAKQIILDYLGHPNGD